MILFDTIIKDQNLLLFTSATILPKRQYSPSGRLDAGPGSASIDKPAHFFSGIAPEPLGFILSLGNRCLCCLPAQSPLPVCCRSWAFFILALPCLHFFSRFGAFVGTRFFILLSCKNHLCSTHGNLAGERLLHCHSSKCVPRRAVVPLEQN